MASQTGLRQSARERVLDRGKSALRAGFFSKAFSRCDSGVPAMQAAMGRGSRLASAKYKQFNVWVERRCLFILAIRRGRKEERCEKRSGSWRDWRFGGRLFRRSPRPDTPSKTTLSEA